MNWLRYTNQNATRNRPLSSRMTDALSFLPDLGVTMEVFSGGQGAAGDGARVGSTRHDHGDAADVFFYKDGRKLDWNNPEDLPLFREIVSRGRQSGLTGFGAGQGYMQPGSMHVGFGDEAVWGAGGKGANAPEWLRASYGGQSPQQSSRSPQQSSQSSQGVGNTQQFPAGILSTQGAAPMEREQAGGLLGSLFPNMDADRADNIRLAVNGWSHNPNRGRAAAIGARMDERRDGRERQRVQAEQQEQANKTAQWLSGQPGGQQYAQAIAGGALPAGEALRMWQAASKGPEQTALMQNVEYIRRQNPNMTFDEALQMAKSGQTINVAGQSVTPETGYRNVYDDNNRLISQEVIPGGPVDVEQQRIAAADQARQRSADTIAENQNTVIGRDVDRLIGMIDNNGFFDLPETGIIGGLLGSAGVNQEAVDFKNTLASIQGAVGFERLKQMREASKTGGALGSVSERELDLLISAYGALQQNTSGPVLKENLKTVKDIMAKIESDPIASSFYRGGATDAPRQPANDGFSVTGWID